MNKSYLFSLLFVLLLGVSIVATTEVLGACSTPTGATTTSGLYEVCNNQTYYINGSVFTVTSHDILDCNGSTFIGNGSGFFVQGELSTSSNFTIKNCNVINYNI